MFYNVFAQKKKAAEYDFCKYIYDIIVELEVFA